MKRTVIDADGHVMEDDTLMDYIDSSYRNRDHLLSWDRLFPSLDFHHIGGHMTRNSKAFGGGKRVGPKEWAEFIDVAGFEYAVVFPTKGLRIGNISNPSWACVVAKAYNSWLHDQYLKAVPVPIESHVLQAFVSEPIKPILDTVVTSGAMHGYISQSDKGELVMGGDLDFYNSYAQRGSFYVVEHVMVGLLALFPAFSRLRMMRTWGGVMDMTMDGSPIICKTPVDGFFINGGWCYGGFKATPGSGWVFAHTIANDAPHPDNQAFTLERFSQGATIDEKGGGPYPKVH